MKCPKCGLEGLSHLRSLVTHLFARHNNEPNFHISCNLSNSNGTCCAGFRSVASYKTHLYRYHKNVPSVSTQTEILCSTCETWHCSLSSLSAHYKNHCHECETVRCLVKHCNFVTELHSSYRAHMSRCHRNATHAHIKNNFKRQTIAAESQLQHEVRPCTELQQLTHEVEVDVADKAEIKRNIGLLLLKLKTQYSLPDSTVQTMVEDFVQILEISSLSLKGEVENVCNKHNIPRDMVADIGKVFEHSPWKTAFQDLSTDWRRNTYYRSEFPYVEPVEYKFSDDVMSCDSFQYIPLLSMLKTLLANSSFRDQLFITRNSLGGHLSTFKDGTISKTHPIFSASHITIELVLYSDEFEVVNPLGPHKKKHKIFAFYFTLGNFQKTCRAQKSSMFLLALCKSTSIQKYGFTRLAEVINKDIAVLETNGIVVDDSGQKLQGAVAFIAGDNLNSHVIGGFNASFSPNVSRPCRFCMISGIELQTNFDADSLNVRTAKDYDRQTVEIEADTSLSQTYGIRSRSPFISGTYHVVDGLPPDIMHDLLEGVVPFELALCLKAFIEKKYFTLDELNNTISSWAYGPLDKANKPVVISATFGETVKQNAGRMWCLLRLLPLMVGSKVSPTDEYWKFLVHLKDIVEMVFAPQLAIGHVILLQQHIQDHLTKFHELFPNKMLKPKQHFLLHYPRFFQLYGPLRLCWCMRFEAKHFYFSHLMQIINNYKNTCSTLAQRHQMKLAYLLAEGNNFLEQPVSLSKTVNVDMDFLIEDVCSALFNAGIVRSKPLHKCKFAVVNGISYYSNMFVVLDIFNDLPVFGQIEAIFVQEMTCFLLVMKFQSNFDDHLTAYSVNPADEIVVCRVDELLDFYPLTAYRVKQQRYIVLKNFVYSHDQFTWSN